MTFHQLLAQVESRASHYLIGGGVAQLLHLVLFGIHNLVVLCQVTMFHVT